MDKVGFTTQLDRYIPYDLVGRNFTTGVDIMYDPFV
jgi:hypothetical protein